MEARTIKTRHLCLIVIAAWLFGLVAALATRNLHYFGILHAVCFLVGGVSAGRIGFTEVPLKRVGIALGLPLALAIYAISGDFLGLGVTVSWALIALSFIAGGRASNLLQMIQQRT